MENQHQGIIASAVIHHDGKIFIAKRADTKTFLPGLWEVPGGHVEFGESVEEALIREVKEEIAVDIIVGDPFYTFSYLPKPHKHMIEVDCFAVLAGEKQVITLNPEDHSAMAWIEKEELGQYFAPEDNTGKALERAFELLLNKK